MENQTTPAYNEMNVYSKLLLARKLFLEANVKKSGINRHLEFKYYELADIVPVATVIGAEIGLLFLTTFTTENAEMKIVNVHTPTEIITITSPMKEIDSIESSRTGGKLTNAVQNLGSAETYQRRYLYMAALDIVENDVFDGEEGEPIKPDPEKPAKRTKKAPVTTEKREEIKAEIVDSDGQAEPLQIEALSNVMEKLLELDPDKEELVQEIVLQTDKLTNISKSACEDLIKELGELVDSYEVVETPTEG